MQRKRHATPITFVYWLLGFSIGVIVLCSFVIKVSMNNELWHKVLAEIHMHPLVIYFAYVMLGIALLIAAMSITLGFTRDKKAELD